MFIELIYKKQLLMFVCHATATFVFWNISCFRIGNIKYGLLTRHGLNAVYVKFKPIFSAIFLCKAKAQSQNRSFERHE